MTIYPKLIVDALRNVRHPENGKNIVELNLLNDDIRIDGNKVSFSLTLRPNDPFARSIVKACEQAILTYVGKDVDIQGNITIKQQQSVASEPANPLPQVKHVIAIASGKGGVGKSTVTANLAIALAQAGCRVGLLDADIHGPSIPKMFHIEEERPVAVDIDGKQLIEPIVKYGIRMLSIGLFVNPQEAIVWRGGMASNALRQLITETNWGELDDLLIDLPPGTSDIHLTIVQQLRLTGAIVVSTPQQVALADAQKAIQMFQNDHIDIPVLGLVENMAWFTPEEHPDERYYIFGRGGCCDLAKQLHLPLLAQIPLVQGLCQSGDQGSPLALETDTPTAQAFAQLAQQIIDSVADKN